MIQPRSQGFFPGNEVDNDSQRLLLKMYVEYMHTKRQVIIKMCKFNMFITAVCVLFLIKLRWPKNKSIIISILENSPRKIRVLIG